MARELLSDRLAQRLIRRIKTGKYVVGDFLPSEPELVQQEGLSRSTVRTALAVLEKKRHDRENAPRGNSGGE